MNETNKKKIEEKNMSYVRIMVVLMYLILIYEVIQYEIYLRIPTETNRFEIKSNSIKFFTRANQHHSRATSTR